MTDLNMDIDLDRLHWKIQVTGEDKDGNPRAYYVPYFDARDVSEKLDELFGWNGWSDTYQVIQTSTYTVVVCEITIHGEREIRKGGMAEITGSGDTAVKGGESDAFKRAAAKLGVGRNVYRLAGIWASAVLNRKGKHTMPKATQNGEPFEVALTAQVRREVEAGRGF